MSPDPLLVWHSPPSSSWEGQLHQTNPLPPLSSEISTYTVTWRHCHNKYYFVIHPHIKHCTIVTVVCDCKVILIIRDERIINFENSSECQRYTWSWNIHFPFARFGLQERIANNCHTSTHNRDSPIKCSTHELCSVMQLACPSESGYQILILTLFAILLGKAKDWEFGTILSLLVETENK
jgi:transposase